MFQSECEQLRTFSLTYFLEGLCRLPPGNSHYDVPQGPIENALFHIFKIGAYNICTLLFRTEEKFCGCHHNLEEWSNFWEVVLIFLEFMLKITKDECKLLPFIMASLRCFVVCFIMPFYLIKGFAGSEVHTIQILRTSKGSKYLNREIQILPGEI